MWLESTSLEVAEEGDCSCILVVIVGTKGVNSIHHPKHHSTNQDRWMEGVWRNVKVEVRRLFVKGCEYFTIL
jgi:hypothetical protein